MAGPQVEPPPVVMPEPAPGPAHFPTARVMSEAPVPQPVVADGSAPVVMRRPPMWPAVTSMVLAMIALGMVAAVLVRCHGSSSASGPSRALIVRLLPKQALNVRGISFSELHRTEAGRQMLAAMSSGFLDDVVDRECDARIGDVLGWMVRMDDGVSRFGGGLTAAQVGWSEEQVNECLTRMARSSGGMLEVKREGELRAYVVRERDDLDRDDETVYAAWVESDIALVVGDFNAERQRAALEEAIGRKAPEKGNDDLRRALELVDTGATFWMAMVRPARNDFPRDGEPDPDDLDDPFDGGFDGDFGEREAIEGWYDDVVAGFLGARPDAVYWSVDVGSRVVVRGGALYKSERKAERVADHVKERFAARDAIDTPDLSRIDPALREALEKRLRESYGRARSVRAAVMESMKVVVDGDVVRFEATLSPDELGEGDLGRRLLGELNSLLPNELDIKL